LTADRKLVNLRRTITPYVGLSVILVGITVFCAYVAHKTSQWNLLWAAAAMWPLFAFAYLYFGLKYRVLWDGIGVYMRASGMKEQRLVRYEDITSIKYEVSASQSRPFRRIVVNGHAHKSDAFVDISLRHFRLEDIEALLTEIQARRPDLTLPKIKIGRDELLSVH
jgi:hypothetical protein